MCKSFNPCNECGYSISKQNQASKMCGICEFKKALQNVKTLSGMYEKLNDKEVSEYHILEEYKGLEKQGRLLKLPCAVGDEFYCLWRNKGQNPIQKMQVKKIEIHERKGIVIQMEFVGNRGCLFKFYEDDFGKTVFLTREEAEAALEELVRTRKNE